MYLFGRVALVVSSGVRCVKQVVVHTLTFIIMSKSKTPIFENSEIKVFRLVDSEINYFDTSVCCGEPEDPGEVPMESVKASYILDAGKDDAYAVEIKGNSMVDAGLEPGDIAIINTSKVAEKGDIVLAYVNNEPYVKYLNIDAEGRIWLVPANKAYKPKLYTEDDNVRIKGVLSRTIKDKSRTNARVLGRLDKLCQDELKVIEAGSEHISPFEQIMCCHNPKEKLRKLHELIDGKRGVYVFRVIKVAFDMDMFSKEPTFAMIRAEFGDIGYSSAYYGILNRDLYEDEVKPIREYLS